MIHALGYCPALRLPDIDPSPGGAATHDICIPDVFMIDIRPHDAFEIEVRPSGMCAGCEDGPVSLVLGYCAVCDQAQEREWEEYLSEWFLLKDGYDTGF